MNNPQLAEAIRPMVAEMFQAMDDAIERELKPVRDRVDALEKENAELRQRVEVLESIRQG